MEYYKNVAMYVIKKVLQCFYAFKQKNWGERRPIGSQIKQVKYLINTVEPLFY